MARKYILLIICLWLFLSWGICFAGPTSTSGDTAADVITRVRYQLNETTADFWSDAELITYIDEAITETVNRTRCLESGASNITILENVRSYSIPGTIAGVSFGGVAKLEYDIGASGNTTEQPQIFDMERVPFSDLDYGKETEKEYPKVFSVWDNSIYIWPIPRNDHADSGVTMSGNIIYFYNLVQPTGVTTTASAIETPSGLDPAIEIYVKARAMYKWHGNPEIFDRDLKRWEARCDWYRVDVMRREIVRETQ